MTGTPDESSDTQISSDATYWPMHMERFGDDTFDLSDRATGCFVRFMNFYVKRNGNVPFEEGKLCERLRYKTVRSFRPVWEELCAAGVIVVAKGMVTCAFGDFVLDQIRKARKQKSDSGKEGAEARARTLAERKAAERSKEHTGGIAGEYDGNTAAIRPEREGTVEQNQAVSFGSASQLKIESEKKDSPLPPQPAGNDHANGSAVDGGKSVQAVIQAFDRLIVEFWGKQAGRRFQASNDAATAVTWLEDAGGDVDRVIKAIEECMAEQVDQGGKVPSALRYYGNPVCRAIAAPGRPATLTTSSPPSAGKAKPGRPAVWVEVRSIAKQNWHEDIVDALGKLGREDPDRANDYAEAVRELVSRPKERAAA